MDSSGPRSRKRRLILLTGSPKCADLSWSEDSLCAELVAPFKADSRIRNASGAVPVWRKLPLQRKDLNSAATKRSFEQVKSTRSGDNNTKWPRVSSGPEHRLLPLEAANKHEHSTSFLSTRMSFANGNISLDDSFWSTSSAPSQLHGPSFDHVLLTDLVKLPPADQVDRERNALGTFNLAVVVLSILPPTKILVGKGPTASHADLVRMIVADETYSSFEISVWLDYQSTTEPAIYTPISNLRDTVSNLEKFDIILIQNVILRTFRNTVNATSLRQLTEVNLLYRDVLEPSSAIRSRYKTGRVNAAVDLPEDLILTKVGKILAWRNKFQHIPSLHDLACNTGVDAKDLPAKARLKSILSLPTDTQ